MTKNGLAWVESAAWNDTHRAKGQRIAFDFQRTPASALDLFVDASCISFFCILFYLLLGVSRLFPATRAYEL